MKLQLKLHMESEMGGYGKIFNGMFTGSMLGAGPVVFALMSYVIANVGRNSRLELNPQLLAVMIGCEVEEIENAIVYLTSPDPNSRTEDHDGRRMLYEGGFTYFVVNYAKYRDLVYAEQNRERVARHRAAKAEEEPKKAPAAKKKVEKKSAVVPDYSDGFEAFWEQTWRRGNKKAAFASWEAIEGDELNAVVAAACEWTSAFERRPADKRPHVSTWLNGRGWEDDLAAELAKAKGDERQVGKTPEKPTMNEEAEKERRKKAVKCIQKHAIHLLEVETDDDQAGKIIRKAAKGLSRLADSTAPPMDMANEFGVIHDQMLSDLFHTLPEEVKGGVDPEKSGYANEEAFLRCRATFRRKAAREFYEISDICDYDWGE